MPTQLVDDVRACLKALDRLPSARERALLVATIARTDGTERDVVDELEAAATSARLIASSNTDHVGGVTHRDALTRLLRAVDRILTPVIPVDDRPRYTRQPLDDDDRRYRRDTDG